MRGDSLSDLLDVVRAEAGLDPETARRVELVIRDRFSGAAVYIQSRRKRSHLEQLQALPDGLTNEEIAARLGISDRHARRLRRLLGA